MIVKVPWPFQLFDPSAEFSAPEYGELLDEVRGMLAALAHAAPGPDLTRALTADVQLWRKELEARRVEDDEAPYGQLHMRDDHAIAALPEIVLHHDGYSVEAWVKMLYSIREEIDGYFGKRWGE